ncbi:MAG: DUF222 domain-containing protein [Actinomycetota bacterium]
MFDTENASVGLLAGEADVASGWCDDGFDDFVQSLAVYELNTGWLEPDRHVLPDGLEEIEPGPFLAAIVSSLDPSRLNGHDAVRLTQARARLSSHHDAGKYQAMAEVAFSPPGDVDSPVSRSSEEIEYAAAEIAAALTLTRGASEAELDRAVSLAGPLRRVLTAFSRGLIDVRKVKVFDSQLGHLPDEIVDTVLDKTLDEAGTLTTGQLQHRLSKEVMVADPDGAASSFQEGLEDRKVTTHSNPDFTGSFHILGGHPDAVAAARGHVERLARGLKVGGDERTLDQIRADVALDLLRGRHFNSLTGGGRVNITVPAGTLLGLSNDPGEFDGYGPVIAEIARKTVSENIDGEWVFTVTDNGLPVATGTLARRPTEGQKRHIQATYPTCVWPGCRMPATESDIDHRHPHGRGGPTTNHNLAPLSRHHHVIRHRTRWRYERLPSGDHKWTSPLGHTYIRKRDPPD